MTTPGGVPNLPQGALTLSNLASDLQDMSGTAMRSRAVQRFPNIFNNSTGLNPAVDLTPFGILTAIWAEVNSLIANADPADVQGPQDIPALVLQFIEGLPVVGQFIGLLEAILGTYAGTDPTLLQVKAIFAPIRAIVDALTAVSGGTGGLVNFFPDLLGVFGLGSSGLGTGSPTIPGVGSIPIFGPLFGLFGGASNSTQAGNFFTSITGLFGNPAGLLTGSPTVPALGSIPILGPVLGLFGGATSATQASNFFTNLLSLLGTPTLTGSTGSFNPATVLTSWINGTINPLNLLTTVTDFTSLLGSFGGATNTAGVNSFITNLLGSFGGATTTTGVNSFITNLLGSFGGATTTTGVNSFITNLLGSFGGATNLTQAGNFFTNLLSMLNTPTLTGSPGSFNPSTALTGWITTLVNPLNALTVPGSGVTSAVPNVLTGAADIIDSLVTQLTGSLGSGFLQADATTALSGTASTIAANAAAIAALDTAQTAATNSGVHALDPFEYVASVLDPTQWATAFLEGSSANGVIGVADGHNAGIIAGGTSGNVTHFARWIGANEHSLTDYQSKTVIVAAAMPNPGWGGGSAAIDVYGRMNDAMTQWVRARFQNNGQVFVQYQNGGAVTQLGSTGSASNPPVGTKLTIESGTTGGLRIYRALYNGSVVASGTDAGTATAVGSSNRGWGFGQRSAGATAGKVTQWSATDNAPVAVVGTTMRVYRSNTAGVAQAAGDNTLPANLYDTVDYISSDMTWNAATSTLTVTKAGTYLFGIRIKSANNLGWSEQWWPLLYIGGTIKARGGARAGITLAAFGAPSFPTDTAVGGDALTYYCPVGTTITPGMGCGNAQSIIGDAGGVVTWFSATKIG